MKRFQTHFIMLYHMSTRPRMQQHSISVFFFQQCNFSDGEKRDMEVTVEDLDSDEYLTDGEEERDTSSYFDILQELNILGTVEKETATDEDLAIVKDLLHGLTLAEKGHDMLSKGCAKIKSVIIKMPSLHKLGNLLEIVKTSDPSLVLRARANSKLPQTGQVPFPSLYKPKKTPDDGYLCKVCETMFGSWVGCDSHIRSQHTHVLYGPCQHCDLFTTSAHDSFKKHVKNCAAKLSNPSNQETKKE